MRSRSELALGVLKTAQQMLLDNLKDLTSEEALAAAGGFRSVLGILKHTARGSHA